MFSILGSGGGVDIRVVPEICYEKGNLMKNKDLVSKVESYIHENMNSEENQLLIAHDFKHIDRVRKWALVIARNEHFDNTELVEVTALLHDIGLLYLDEKLDRRKHGEVGAEFAAEFLRKHSDYSTEEISQIADAIKYHSLSPSIITEYLSTLGESGRLLEILRDADNLDGLGAIGIMRAVASKYYLPDYDPENIKGQTWGLSDDEFLARFKYGVESVKFVVDQINQQIRYYDSFHTLTAKQIATPLVQFMRDFVLQLEREFNHGK